MALVRKLRSKFDQFEFTSFYVTDIQDAKKCVTKLLETPAPLLGLDIETAKLPPYETHPRSGLDPLLSRIRLIQLYTGRDVYIFDLFKIPTAIVAPILHARKWIAHYAIFEISHLFNAGVRNLDVNCSKILSQLIFNAENSPYQPTEEEEADLEESPDGLSKYRYMGKGHSLEEAVAREFGVRLDKALQTSDWGAPELSTEQLQYAAVDAVMTYHLGKKLYPKVKKYKMERHYKLLSQFQHVISDMHLRGMPVDWETHQKFVNRWDEAQGKAQRQCYGYFGDINLNSTQQLNGWLEKQITKHPHLKSWPKTSGGKSGKGSYSFSALTLANYAKMPAIGFLLEYKQYSKLLSTYGESFAEMRHPITGRIHAEYTLAETRTGRLSAKRPNIQQWPRGESRACFAPKSGSLVVADFSQIELRIQAELSRDSVMRKVFREGRDIYCEMASHIFGREIKKGRDDTERQFGKIIMLSLGYGMGAPKFAQKASIELDREVKEPEARKAWESYRRKFKRYIEWCDEVRHKAKELGFARTVLGKVRRLLPEEIYTKGPNMEVQGTAFEVNALSLIKMRKDGVKLLCNIHDEVHSYAKEGEEKEEIEKVNAGMNAGFNYLFPDASCKVVANAKAAKNWYEAK